MNGIRRLAHDLNISIGTVSRALNGKPDVSDETRKRVLEAAAAIGYVPNQAGRSLRQGKTGVIGFMMQSGSEITGDGDVFFMSVFDGVQTVCARHQLDLVVLLCSSEEDPDAYLQRVVARGFVDGLIISATKRHDHRIQFLAERNIPFIALGRSLTEAGHPWLDLDFEGMAQTGVDRLVQKGHRRIGVFAPIDDINLGFVFVDSYRAALERHGIAFDPDLVFRAYPNDRGGHEIGERVAAMPEDKRPTGFVLTNEMLTVGLYRGLYDCGIRPGADIAIIGRHSTNSQYLNPKLTCFYLSLRDLGIELAEGLLATMPAYAAHYPHGVIRRVVPLTLIEGGSDQPAKG
ncbi:LacI family DNA-binding transcriptional regulator [Devosia sp. 63-57]|uniref:LacI family DNA-binding transcriptional regulator n=1 Tax=Devosia sp. 63-57 TaxID=1895751 RepID=UPI000868D99F|nr:LacI family DNA-binding transcriptional regulator [Devosia sp. 63-57]ODT47261.1 MAG: LacI family transcriptional regulator [Pelagibacterium sp. SCN 63-126]ODU89079.1 MAG: LacI family transcriptional regulator [Pelagibacterium sp. SCN 63-17]OJX43029.1 MAG: LacI family transcriptional regulator [Devosia sp. 63-57]